MIIAQGPQPVEKSRDGVDRGQQQVIGLVEPGNRLVEFRKGLRRHDRNSRHDNRLGAEPGQGLAECGGLFGGAGHQDTAPCERGQLRRPLCRH